MACGSIHPEHPAVRCIAPDSHPNHDHHFAMAGGEPTEWENASYVAPAPKAMKRSAARSRLKELADQVPPARRTGQQAKAEGIAEAQSGTDPEWARAFDARLRELARAGQPFTSEDVVSVVGLPPGHPSAVGARMNAAAKSGLIEKVGFTQAERVNQHAAMLTQWCGVS